MKALCLAAAVWLSATSAFAQTRAAPFKTCMNLSNALEADGPEGTWGYTIRDADIERIARAGFEAVRIPVRFSQHFDGARIDPALLARVDHVVQTALEAGLYAIIEVHHYTQLMEDPARHAPRLEAIWAALAAHYRDWPQELVFELLNEPWNEMTAKRTDTLNARLVAAIRQSHPRRWIIVSGADWGGLRGMLQSTPPAGARLIASFHYYEPFSFTHQGAPFIQDPPPAGQRWGNAAERAEVAAHMEAARDFGETWGIPVFMGEFGVYKYANAPDRVQWITHTRRSAEALGIAWCHWGFGVDFAAYDLERERWHGPIIEALLGP